MNKRVRREQMLLLREWVIAEIDYALASGAEGADGYLSSARNEKLYAQLQFDYLIDAVLSGESG